EDVAAAASLLEAARRPLVLAGSGVFWAGAWDGLVELVERLGAAVITSQAARGVVPGAHPNHVAAARSRALQRADVGLVVGSDREDVAAAASLLEAARRPLVLAGSGVFWAGAWDGLVELVERLGAAVITSQAARGVVPGAHPNHVAAARSRALQRADVVLVVG